MRHKKRIRLAKRKDRIEIKELNERCLSENYDMAFFENIIGDKNSFVFEIDSLKVGYIMCDVNGHIVSFAVLEEYRKLGYGRRLLNECYANLKGKKVKQMSLNVRCDNEGAIKLYESFGFVKDYTVEEYYKDKMAAYFMLKSIDYGQKKNLILE
ncbi:MAG: ribosomal-protein-alanine N-acetyltransferase [Hyperionvirus sp.]|uniref:Ribosomal-protein-alanine N-acetyltransferase n=1 Tax=Hyperionvirus sp. TaxID=2487770 RepID=A0A3G5AA86_9VIRU|nr:MAG: ribosomal-protein-alanine N-acetyltransferase [Hyperionvirus sp.]